MEVEFEPGTLVPDPPGFLYKMLLDPHHNSESGKSASVSELNIGTAQRCLVTDMRSVSKKVAPLGVRVHGF